MLKVAQLSLGEVFEFLSQAIVIAMIAFTGSSTLKGEKFMNFHSQVLWEGKQKQTPLNHG